MEFTTLGRTELRVSRMGLGCGGHSRLGLANGASESESEAIVRSAISFGINFIDTAESYGTEEVVGRAISRTPREKLVISTKAGVGWQERRCTGDEMRERVHACLARLRTDYIDIFHIHGLSLDDYMYASVELLPVLLDLKLAGKIRYVGVTEAFGPDPGHRMMNRAVDDAFWDVVMVGFNILNQSARSKILVRTQEKAIGTLCMFAVRRAMSHPETLPDIIRNLVTEGAVDESRVDLEDPLGFVTAGGVAGSVQEAAYRFCLHEPGIDVVLSGTGNLAHLKSNVAALCGDPLPEEVATRLRTMFQRVDTISGN
ncbi:MAG: aldo/keto reductase [Fimbriimonas sp.]|nr:aldo/keto reductase [Fimbriimonas sp.]